MNYLLLILTYFDVYLILSLSLNLLVGYCGLFTLAHAAFFATGAYTYAVLTISAGCGLFTSTIGAVLIAGLLSLTLSIPSWHLQKNFFLLVSLAVQALVFGLIYNWSNSNGQLGSWTNLTNGPFGITGIKRPPFLGFEYQTPLAFAVLASSVAAGSLVVMRGLMGSPWGRLLQAMRDDELALRGLGKNTRLAKVQACCISAGFAAIAGVLYAAHIQYIDPSTASLDHSILMLSVVIVGGLGTFSGSVVGALTRLSQFDTKSLKIRG